MRLLRLTALVLAAACLMAAASPRNWISSVVVTPSGGHLLGNPQAQIKLVEYVSYTCPHCAHFQQQADAPLRLGYVQPGRVSLEVRHFVRDPVDMTVAMLTNCGAPARFYQAHNAFLRSQDRWMATYAKASDAQKARWTTGENAARMRAIAADFGFYTMMEQHGLNRPVADRCLADAAMMRRLTAQTVEAQRLGVSGTPSFLLDDTLLAGTHDWPALNLQLEARF